MAMVNVTVSVGKDQVMKALRDLTINRDEFDPGPWSIWDAECLELAAALVRREIAESSLTPNQETVR